MNIYRPNKEYVNNLSIFYEPTRTSHPQEEGIGHGLAHDPRNPTEVGDGIVKQHEVQGRRRCQVVVVQIMIKNFVQLWKEKSLVPGEEILTSVCCQ